MLPESKNIQTITDNIRSLDKRIDALDVEIPPHASSDAGKILAVNSDGYLEWRNETQYIPPAYSTEEVNTGQKWIDGRDIYCKVINGIFPEITQSASLLILSGLTDIEIIDSIVITTSTANTRAINRYPVNHTLTGELYLLTVQTAYSEGTYDVVLYYVKTPETKSKKGGTKK